MNQSNVHLEYTQKINQLMFGLLVLGFPTALILKWTGSDFPLWALAITFIVPAVIGGLHLKRLNPHVISLYTVMGVLGVASSLALTWAGDFSFVLMAIISLLGLYLELNYTLAAGVVLTGLMVWSHSHSGASGHWGITLVAGLAITFAWSYLTQIIGQHMHLSNADVSNDLGQVSRLDETLREIQAVSYDLDQEIMSFDENLANITESSNTFVMTLNELAQGATEQSNSVNEITNMVTGADQRISEISQLSSKLMVISEAAANHVGEGYQNILSMYNQMGSINYSVETSRHIIEQLSAYMDSINASLSAISQIASQTNLLALNAAIEAARAGESGRGFAVVAGEVKKLADQSSQTVSEITEALNFIRDKTHEVLIKSNEEREAVNTGAQIVEQVTNGFDSIKTAFDEIKAYIADEMNMVKDSESIFSGIRAEMESISSILEESAASSEEMLAHSQEQAASLEQIQNAIDQLKESSSQLHQMASQ